jgi:hypothetical protein
LLLLAALAASACASLPEPTELLQLYLRADALAHRIEQAKKDQAAGTLTPEEVAAIITEANELLLVVRAEIERLRAEGKVDQLREAAEAR